MRTCRFVSSEQPDTHGKGNNLTRGRTRTNCEHWNTNTLHNFFYVLLTVDRLCGLLVRVSAYRHRGLGFDSRGYQIFWVVEMTGIINKPLLLRLVGCLYYLYQWCTVKPISDNEIYLLIKYIKSVLWRVAKRLSYIEDATCLKVKLRQGTINLCKQTEWLYRAITLNCDAVWTKNAKVSKEHSASIIKPDQKYASF